MLGETKTSDKALVLHVRGVTGYGGGPEKTILNSPRFLREKNYDSVCAYMHSPADAGVKHLRDQAHSTGAEFLSVHDRGPLDWRTLKQLISYCRKNKVAIWHGHDYKSNCFGLAARRFWPMKLVTTVHGWVQQTRRTPLYYAIDKHCLPRYDEVICVSDDLYTAALGCRVRPEKCHWIHNAIDVEEFKRRIPVSNIKPTPEAPLILGAMGRLSAEKGFDLLIRAVAELNQKGVPCRLLIAGDGDLHSKLENLIIQLGCQATVELLGQVTDVKAFFEGLDLFVLSSLREGLPNVVLEAMALEVPVVSTRVAGIPKLITSCQNGILVDSESVAELMHGIRTLAFAPELRLKLAAAGRKTIEQSFSFQARMDKIANLYDSLLRRSAELKQDSNQQLVGV